MSSSTSRLNYRGVKWIAFGWTSFIAENLILSENRREIINRYGETNYHIVYNSLSTFACGSIAYGWLRHGISKGPTIGPARSPLVRISGVLLQAIGLIGFSQLFPKLQMPIGLALDKHDNHGTSPVPTNLPPDDIAKKTNKTTMDPKIYFKCPIDFKAAREEGKDDGLFGVDRVTRHPFLWSLGFLGLGYAFRSVYIAEIVMGAFPALFAAIGGAHKDHRHRRGEGGTLTKEDEAKTSHVPFLALVEGRQSWQKLGEEFKTSNALLSLLLLAVFKKR